MNRIRRGLSDQSGQVAVMVALLAVAMVSALALVVDVGVAYESRRALQNAVDAAALAGVAEIAEGRGPASAQDVAATYVADNFGRSARVEVSFPDDSRLKVGASVTNTTFFARVMGTASVTVKAGATAATGMAREVENLVPIIVPLQSVDGHVGADNQTSFELGEDRPLESLSITYKQVGSRVVYSLAFVNTAQKSVDLELWSPVPAGTDYLPGSATGGGTLGAGAVRWLWSSVASGDRRAVEFAVDLSGGGNPKNDVYAKTGGNSIQTASTNDSQRGFFWLVDFDGGSNPTPGFADWIANGYPDPVGVGFAANGTGVRSSLKAALSERVASDPAVVLPLYDYTEGGGNNGVYHVVGFAEFVITGFELSSNPKSVTGYFTNGTVTAGAGGGGPQPDFGVRVVWLSE